MGLASASCRDCTEVHHSRPTILVNGRNANRDFHFTAVFFLA